MNWEELSKQYEKTNKKRTASKKVPAGIKGWSNLVKSTDKLVWLFLMSDSSKSLLTEKN